MISQGSPWPLNKGAIGSVSMNDYAMPHKAGIVSDYLIAGRFHKMK